MKLTRKYYTEGSKDLPEGLTLGFYTEDEDGNRVSGKKKGFQWKAISKKQFLALRKEIKKATRLGNAMGLLSAKGKKAQIDNLTARKKRQDAQRLRQKFGLAHDADVDAYLQIQADVIKKTLPKGLTKKEHKIYLQAQGFHQMVIDKI